MLGLTGYWTEGRMDGRMAGWMGGMELWVLFFSSSFLLSSAGWMPMSGVCETQGEGEASVSSDMSVYSHGCVLKKPADGGRGANGKPACATDTQTPTGQQQIRRRDKHGHGMAPRPGIGRRAADKAKVLLANWYNRVGIDGNLWWVSWAGQPRERTKGPCGVECFDLSRQRCFVFQFSALSFPLCLCFHIPFLYSQAVLGF